MEKLLIWLLTLLPMIPLLWSLITSSAGTSILDFITSSQAFNFMLWGVVLGILLIFINRAFARLFRTKTGSFYYFFKSQQLSVVLMFIFSFAIPVLIAISLRSTEQEFLDVALDLLGYVVATFFGIITIYPVVMYPSYFWTNNKIKKEYILKGL